MTDLNSQLHDALQWRYATKQFDPFRTISAASSRTSLAARIAVRSFWSKRGLATIGPVTKSGVRG